ncbi:NUDIX hydrolase [Simiduia sp. 21SJ11W-1]|uniref:NUDIX hydrolase n=1 Tax=Simiduia sp. 21SJ11W-1 TaxID=2909669 RepID=UPI0020A15D89|nr:NUDIX hydrolase [Simiduia sp. 21SJ11W-1]UTA46962.1 NUDIX hydrolase [Simiduia sp. 21SJ11W-1]
MALPPANAGCLIVHQGRVLVVEQWGGALAFPGGGFNVGESPSCTAARETYEETGMAVMVEQLQHTFTNGFQLYQCTLLSPAQALGDGINLPFNMEVRALHWVAFSDKYPRKASNLQADASAWRFPDQHDFLRAYFAARLPSQAKAAR